MIGGSTGVTIGDGMDLTQTTGAQVTGNQVVGNSKGIWLLSGDSNVLTGNVVSGNIGSGIVLGNSGNPFPLTNSRVSSNTTNLNGQAGIQILTLQSGSFGNEIFSNTSSVGNKGYDLEDDNAGCGTDFWSGSVHFTTFQTPLWASVKSMAFTGDCVPLRCLSREQYACDRSRLPAQKEPRAEISLQNRHWQEHLGIYCRHWFHNVSSYR